MAIPYRAAKFKSANILAIAILGSTTKFNSHQYFRLCGRFIQSKLMTKEMERAWGHTCRSYYYCTNPAWAIYVELKPLVIITQDVLLMSGLIFIFTIGGIGTAVSSKEWSKHHDNTDVTIAHYIGASSVSNTIT